MPETSFRDRVSLLLGGLEEGREVRAYLRRFSRRDDGCFAVVKVGGAILEQELGPLADALALLQLLGLPPVVVFGAGPQLDRELGEAGIELQRRDGLRVTPGEAVPLIARETGRMTLALQSALRSHGAAALALPMGTVTARIIDEERYGCVGDVASVDGDAVLGVLETGAVPLLSCIHPDEKGRLLNVNADGVARALSSELKPQKIVFVTGTGGVLDGAGALIDSINLAAEGDALFASDWLEGGMRHKLSEIAELLSHLPPSSSVSITSASGLVRELFTHSGQGTLIRQGEAIRVAEQADPQQLQPLIEAAFGKTLKPDYWKNIEPVRVLTSEHGRGCAIVTRLGSVDVLDKFVVSAEARGEGLAKSLWRQLSDLSPEMIWRSRSGNAFNAFYSAVADGFVRRGAWVVYWTGRGVEGRVPELADVLASKPGDFEGET
ncbi:acetylglutamate kinase [Parvularcula lutaonensis]|uniref:acetylglutamate kinase n=1 Tax=Parvularcula lutaonensis TaxID=491923 RepID=A0ABV7M8D8_9PROT|nr:acetylglutamate kinase [Parvularcula lutaonensis]GGY56643.1 acetylglutamate kinase [Parvularcula lutaonensis]